MITIRITKDDVTPHLRRIFTRMQPGGAASKILGRAAANELRRHFRDLNTQRPNRLGGKRSNFYSRVAETVQNPREVPGGISVAISHPHIAQRLFGGPITPRKKKALAIPIHASSYGVFARIYPGTLAFIPSRTGRGGVLVEAEERSITRGPRKGGKRRAPKPGGVAIYAITGFVAQRADHTVLPHPHRMVAALTRAAQLLPP